MDGRHSEKQNRRLADSERDGGGRQCHGAIRFDAGGKGSPSKKSVYRGKALHS